MQLNNNSKKEVLMNRTRLALASGILLATAFVFSCGDSGNEPADNANLCGDKPFKPSTEFCYSDVIYNKCDGKTFNPLDSFCYNNRDIYEGCSGAIYDVNNAFCYSGQPYPKCGGNQFNPLESYCNANTVNDYPKCGSIPYNSNVSYCDSTGAVQERCGSQNNGVLRYGEFCYYLYDNNLNIIKIIATKCDGSPYNPVINFCDRNNHNGIEQILERCSDRNNVPYDSSHGVYNYSTQFCTEDRNIVNKCGGREYDSSKQFCSPGDSIVNLCGGNVYDVVNQFCDNGDEIRNFSWCGSNHYDALRQFCDNSSGSVYSLCNAKTYNVINEFCSGNQIYPKCLDVDGITGANNTGNIVDYDPSRYGCFGDIPVNRELYHRCDLKTTRGLCVYRNNLRCKQADADESEYVVDTNKIVNPYPWMKCESGTEKIEKITGTVLHGSINYRTVQIGNQVWLAQNLNGTTYTWATAMQKPISYDTIHWPPPNPYPYTNRQGLCPNGWRIPNRDEWQKLIDYAGGKNSAGHNLKAEGNYRGTDIYGFNAIPTIGWAINSFSNVSADIWLTSTQSSESNPSKASMANLWYVISEDNQARELEAEKSIGYSVRCLQNIEQ
jgi:uncharacterized protein (TIGR02145 family)